MATGKQIIFVTKQELLSERQALMAEAAKLLAKIVSLNALYNGRILKIQRKIKELEMKCRM